MCQITSEPEGLEGAHGVSLDTLHRHNESLPEAHAAWVMSDGFCSEGGRAIAGSVASASPVATGTGQAVGSPEKLGSNPTRIQRRAAEAACHSFS